MLSESNRKKDKTENKPQNRLPVPTPADARLSETRTEQPKAEPYSMLDWSFFAQLSIPGESAVYSLHDGTTRFLEVAGLSEDIWGAPSSHLKGETLAGLIENGSDLKDWLFDLERQRSENSYRANLCNPNPKRQAIQLKAIPLFISSNPSETRIVVKAAPLANSHCNSRAFPTNLNLSSLHRFDGCFESVNASWTELLGGSLDDFKDLNIFEIVHAKDKDRLELFFAQTKVSETVQSSIIRFRGEAGRTKSVLLSARADSQRQLIVLEGKNLTVEQANPAMDLLKTSVELISESVLLLMKSGPSFRICYANRAFEEMTGYRFTRISGSSISCLNGAKTNARAILDIEEALQAEEEHHTEILLYRRDESSFWANATLIPLRDNQGVANYFAVILADASEVKAVSEELARKNEELQAALKDLKETQKAIIQQESLRALGQMASGIAHDFNNLLAPILGFSELLLTIPPNARDEKKLVSYLKKIQVAAQDGAAVVSRLREFYRSQSSPEEFIQIHPEELLWQVKELTRHRWKNQAEAKGLNIKFQMEIASHRSIMGNEPELRQVFTNLIINAVDALEHDGNITVNVSDSEDLVRISISDTGCGMNEETRQKCLEPFFTTKGKLGTGLGLSIVFGVVQRHHGTFNIKSIEGEGTQIIMEFPAIQDQGRADSTSRATPKSKSLRIMLVDDEEVLLEVVSELLASGGHIVDVFAEPNGALDAFRSNLYDLVITDRAMPLMSGDQLAAAIKKTSPSTPIFMITGFGDLIKDSGDIPENIDEVLGKPVPLDVLNRKLAELVARK